jgi:2-polyprenyl-3-methyl-5-hydroxy-6-metoxy-1,4-benzoquinol methylase
LEIGCSHGIFSSLLKNHGFGVYASDISDYAVRYARKFYPEIKFFKRMLKKEYHSISNSILLFLNKYSKNFNFVLPVKINFPYSVPTHFLIVNS